LNGSFRTRLSRLTRMPAFETLAIASPIMRFVGTSVMAGLFFQPISLVRVDPVPIARTTLSGHCCWPARVRTTISTPALLRPRERCGRRRSYIETSMSAEEQQTLMLSGTPGLFAAELRGVAHTARRRDRREDFAVVRWYLYRQEAAFAATYHVEGYAHASRERFGVMAGSLLGHEAGSSLHQTAGCPTNGLKRKPSPGCWV
jgi:hypothetical protein